MEEKLKFRSWKHFMSSGTFHACIAHQVDALFFTPTKNHKLINMRLF